MIGQSLQIIEEINDDFLRDEIESIAQYYNFQFPGDVIIINNNNIYLKSNIQCT